TGPGGRDGGNRCAETARSRVSRKPGLLREARGSAQAVAGYAMNVRDVELRQWIYPAVVVGALLILWQLVGSSPAPTPTSTPSPTGILAAILREPGLYFGKPAITFFEAAAGLALAVTAGVLIASAFVLSNTVRAGFLPLVIALQTIPLIAVAPILNVYF